MDEIKNQDNATSIKDLGSKLKKKISGQEYVLRVYH